MPGWGKSSGKRGPPYPLLGFWGDSLERKWRKGASQELEPGEADKCGGEEQAGTQDLGEKTDEQRKVFGGRVTGSELSYLRLVEKQNKKIS